MAYNIDFDALANTNGGLMDQILKLTAPPMTEETIKRQRKAEREANQVYRTRPGKNHDTCDSCREGGDLLCCDKCPCAFHLQCHDPPLEEEDVPKGEWLCHKCISEKEKKLIEMENAKKGITPSTPVPLPELGGIFEHPLQTLARAARSMNPSQFELPRYLMPNISLPGTSKRKSARDLNGKAPTKKPAHELDNGIVPLPVKTCFMCAKSCAHAPLIQCDYCPLLFHADCLDPPLTVLPAGHWRCPNHAENFLDENLCHTGLITERIRLYDKYTGPVDPNQVMVNFLRRCHKRNPASEPELSGRKTIDVPGSIRDQYRYPVDPQQVVRGATTYSVSIPSTSSIAMNINTEQPGQPLEGAGCTATEEEQEEWLASIVNLQASIARHMAQRQLSKGRPVASVLPMRTDTPSPAPAANVSESVALMKSQSITPTAAVSPTLLAPDKPAVPVSSRGSADKRPHPSRSLSTNGSRSGPPAKTSQPSSANQPGISTDAVKLNQTLTSYIDGNADVELNKYDEKLLRILAWQRLQQLTTKAAKTSTGTENVEMVAPSGLMAELYSDRTEERVRARAVLTLLNVNSGKAKQFNMVYRDITVGLGSSCDMDLNLFGKCNNISTEHASIFYDTSSSQYELLNYSPHGTSVDGVFYGCEMTEDHLYPEPADRMVTDVKECIADYLKAVPCMSREATAKVRNEPSSCNCHNTPQPPRSGWEGSALLYHGSVISIGCLRFVFSIVDVNRQLEADQTEREREESLEAEITALLTKQNTRAETVVA